MCLFHGGKAVDLRKLRRASGNGTDGLDRKPKRKRSPKVAVKPALHTPKTRLPTWLQTLKL